MKRHPLTRDDIDLEELGAELSETLARPVALVAQLSGQQGEAGQLLPAQLAVVDAETGEHLDVDESVVGRAITTHLPPETALSTPEDEFLAVFDSAVNDRGRLNAVRAYVARKRDDQYATRSRPTRRPLATERQLVPREIRVEPRIVDGAHDEGPETRQGTS